ncbi:Sigma-54-dependent Fis family transcriptional regulator [Rickettsiales endosymbiont of Paramecium tredecaurelia]|uniref:sigma-54-dependent transcriptional regulator n=1 Tax=Candidatus Sarmatiella mevalonica TaxID=2770581 RepID=UPI0019213B08|nr:sigma-54 dependent transcriptional regulator [Candidatus Sarmatiella mevalonica]MBL3284596.1 Sigma-54-dependent Fis family transcriptional regulator [Candidatus Sarmatiella mevalonica]
MVNDVLVIDDEIDIINLVTDILKEEGYKVKSAFDSTSAFQILQEKVPQAIILDVWLQGSELDGLGILEVIKQRYPLLPVIMISGHGTIDTAVSAIRLGAYDYIEKPFAQDRLLIVLKRALESFKLKRENINLRSKVVDRIEFIGNSVASTRLKVDIERAAKTSSRIMIHGLSGTGKKLVAKFLHKKSSRANGPFITFDPTGMSSELMCQQLFGLGNPELHGGFERSVNLLMAANGGILYISEVGGLSTEAQARLLKFLQDNQLINPQTGQIVKLDVRFIVSTSQDLEKCMTAGEFKQDLYHRLNIVSIKVPSLSERKEDIDQLVKYFVKYFVKYSGLRELKFSSETIATMQSYHWPNNIRQLKNLVEWVLITHRDSKDGVVKPDMLSNEVLSSGSSYGMKLNFSNKDLLSLALRDAREEFEVWYLDAQLERFNYNISKVAAYIDMNRCALHKKIRKLYPKLAALIMQQVSGDEISNLKAKKKMARMLARKSVLLAEDEQSIKEESVRNLLTEL